MSELPSNVSFWRYLITPKGKSNSLIICFLFMFLFGMGDLSQIFTGIADFGTNGSDKTMYDVLNIMWRFIIFIFCCGLSLYLAREIYREYKEDHGR